jgi:hypothetical protein
MEAGKQQVKMQSAVLGEKQFEINSKKAITDNQKVLLPM